MVATNDDKKKDRLSKIQSRGLRSRTTSITSLNPLSPALESAAVGAAFLPSRAEESSGLLLAPSPLSPPYRPSSRGSRGAWWTCKTVFLPCRHFAPGPRL